MACLMTLNEKLTCSSHALILLERLSLVPTHRYPMMKMAAIFFETCDVDEEVVITFEECLTAAQQDSAQKSWIAETSRQLKCRKLTMGFHNGKLTVLPA